MDARSYVHSVTIINPKVIVLVEHARQEQIGSTVGPDQNALTERFQSPY